MYSYLYNIVCYTAPLHVEDTFHNCIIFFVYFFLICVVSSFPQKSFYFVLASFSLSLIGINFSLTFILATFSFLIAMVECVFLPHGMASLFLISGASRLSLFSQGEKSLLYLFLLKSLSWVRKAEQFFHLFYQWNPWFCVDVLAEKFISSIYVAAIHNGLWRAKSSKDHSQCLCYGKGEDDNFWVWDG